MKLLVDETVIPPITGQHLPWGATRRFVWETGHADEPYLVSVMSYIVNGYTKHGDLVGAHHPGAITYDWSWFGAKDFAPTLSSAWCRMPSRKDILPVSGGEFVTLEEADRSAMDYLKSARPEDARPEEFAFLLEMGLHRLLGRNSTV